MSRGLEFDEPVIFERGSPGRTAASLPPLDVPSVDPKSVGGCARANSLPSCPR